MNYTIESIYYEFGQFEKVVTLSFKENSSYFNELPENLTGVFIYSKAER